MLPRVSGKVVLRLLQKEGFLLLRIKGSHHFLGKPGANSAVLVPVHGNRDLPVGTLRSIIRQAGMTVEQFAAALGRAKS